MNIKALAKDLASRFMAWLRPTAKDAKAEGFIDQAEFGQRLRAHQVKP